MPSTEDLIREAGRFRQAGKWAEAAAAYTRALAQSPSLAESWYNLGFVQRQASRFEEALASYQQAVDRGAQDREEIHLNRGVIYADHLNRPADAERELELALAIKPNYPAALFNLANLKEDQGARDEARALYERVLALQPGAHEALARLAQISDADDVIVRRLRGALALELSAADRASLNFALGQVLDRTAAFDDAFDAYVVANQASRSSAPAQAPLYDRAREEKAIDQLMLSFPTRRLDVAAVGPAPVFICGMFRSGSTLIEQVLAGHPDVAAGGELPMLPRSLRELAPFPSSFPGRGAAELGQIARQLLDEYRRVLPGDRVMTDKRPDNFLLIGLIKALFPDAKIVHTVRHPLDNVLSIYFLHLDHGMSYALDLMDAAHHYRQYRRLMAHWKAIFGSDILDVDYDAFVREPRPATESLLQFLGLPWHDECLSFHRRTNVVKTASVWQVREPLYQRSSGRWRNYARQLEPARAYLEAEGVRI